MLVGSGITKHPNKLKCIIINHPTNKDYGTLECFVPTKARESNLIWTPRSVRRTDDDAERARLRSVFQIFHYGKDQ